MGVAAHACLLFAVNGRQGMFKAGFDKYSIIPLFNPNHPDIIDNKNDRWVDYIVQIIFLSVAEQLLLGESLCSIGCNRLMRM
jgi:hypothetical protein